MVSLVPTRGGTYDLGLSFLWSFCRSGFLGRRFGLFLRRTWWLRRFPPKEVADVHWRWFSRPWTQGSWTVDRLSWRLGNYVNCRVEIAVNLITIFTAILQNCKKGQMGTTNLRRDFRFRLCSIQSILLLCELLAWPQSYNGKGYCTSRCSHK